jgi:hypothetical protein
MVPAAPGRCSTTTVRSQTVASLAANPRATVSVAPPAVKGTTILTGFSWANAEKDSMAQNNAGSARRIFILTLLVQKRVE